MMAILWYDTNRQSTYAGYFNTQATYNPIQLQADNRLSSGYKTPRRVL